MRRERWRRRARAVDGHDDAIARAGARGARDRRNFSRDRARTAHRGGSRMGVLNYYRAMDRMCAEDGPARRRARGGDDGATRETRAPVASAPRRGVRTKRRRSTESSSCVVVSATMAQPNGASHGSASPARVRRACRRRRWRAIKDSARRGGGARPGGSKRGDRRVSARTDSPANSRRDASQSSLARARVVVCPRATGLARPAGANADVKKFEARRRRRGGERTASASTRTHRRREQIPRRASSAVFALVVFESAFCGAAESNFTIARESCPSFAWKRPPPGRRGRRVSTSGRHDPTRLRATKLAS